MALMAASRESRAGSRESRIRALSMPVGFALELDGERQNGRFVVRWADDLQAERKAVPVEAHGNGDAGPAEQVARPAVAAHVLKRLVQVFFNRWRALQQRRRDQ